MLSIDTSIIVWQSVTDLYWKKQA